jgi:hypothetical protein
MIGWLIVACEIGFWIFILSGLIARYIFKMPKTSAVLLICTPLTDLVLLIATAIDLKGGATANMLHGLAAIYLGASIVYGHKMVKWADRWFEYRFAGGPKPEKRKTYGSERAKEERIGWYQHFFAWAIGCSILLGMILLIEGLEGLQEIVKFMSSSDKGNEAGGPSTLALAGTMRVWTMVLVIDFVISFSYTVFPKEAPKQAN